MSETAPPRRQLNVRLPPDIIEQIEAGKSSKQDVVEDALRAWYSNGIAYNSSKNNGRRADGSNEIADDSGNVADDSHSNILVTSLTRQLVEKDQQISELHIMLQTAITPQPQLSAASQARKWWQVWKRGGD